MHEQNIFAAMYPFLRRLMFRLPPETAHAVSMNALKFFCALPVVKNQLQKFFESGRGEGIAVFGLHFKNRIGLGAGFDKNALYLRELEILGFGFVEIGTVTPKPQPGNDKPRLFRLPKDKALINRMGFNNDGVEVVAARLQQWRSQPLGKNKKPMLIGGNIGKNKETPNEDAWKDYVTCFHALHPYVDFFVVNVSSPNTPGLRALQEKDSLRKIFRALQEQNKNLPQPRPILLKIAPDLNAAQLDDVLSLALEINLDGMVATNTTIAREPLNTSAKEVEEMGAGGLSGKPLQERSTEIIKIIHTRTRGKLPVIGSGGIFTAQDVREKLEAGATLVEVWTGFIYEGPFIVKKILQQL